MANRFPLVANSSSNQIQELAIGDNLDLTSSGIVNAGVITATSFSGSGSALTGVVTTGGGQTIGGNLTISGDLTINGTQTVINTNVLDVSDINVGIASTSSKLTNAQLDGAGITIYGSQGDKSLTWSNSNSRLSFSTDIYAPRYYGDGSGLTGVS